MSHLWGRKTGTTMPGTSPGAEPSWAALRRALTRAAEELTEEVDDVLAPDVEWEVVPFARIRRHRVERGLQFWALPPRGPLVESDHVVLARRLWSRSWTDGVPLEEAVARLRADVAAFAAAQTST